MRDVLPFASILKEIEFVLKIQSDALMVLCGIFFNPVITLMVYKENQGAIALAVSPQMRPRTKHTAIKYHHFWSFVLNGDIKIKHVGTE